MEYTVLLRNGRYALLEMKNQYVVACDLMKRNQKVANGHKDIIILIGIQAKL